MIFLSVYEEYTLLKDIQFLKIYLLWLYICMSGYVYMCVLVAGAIRARSP